MGRSLERHLWVCPPFFLVAWLIHSNVIELLIAILALVKGDIDIVQASMIGSILSNILLVLGMSYFAGGLRFHEQLYALAGAQMHISLLGLSVRLLITPAVRMLMTDRGDCPSRCLPLRLPDDIYRCQQRKTTGCANRTRARRPFIHESWSQLYFASGLRNVPHFPTVE